MTGSNPSGFGLLSGQGLINQQGWKSPDAQEKSRDDCTECQELVQKNSLNTDPNKEDE